MAAAPTAPGVRDQIVLYSVRTAPIDVPLKWAAHDDQKRSNKPWRHGLSESRPLPCTPEADIRSGKRVVGRSLISMVVEVFLDMHEYFDNH
jgi:hypothetical protein